MLLAMWQKEHLEIASFKGKRILLAKPSTIPGTSFLVLLYCLLVLQACQKAERPEPLNAAALKPIGISELRLNSSTSCLDLSNDSFAYFEGGHFAEKTQYNGRVADEFGGAYAVHCRHGKPFNIEVKYQQEGIDQKDAMKIMERLLSPDPGEIVEHDDEDLKKMDAAQAAEFFYFKNGPYARLLYARNSDKKVVEISVWARD